MEASHTSRTALKQAAARWAITSNGTLTVLKLVAGLASGSVGIFAELVNSSADLVGSLVVFWSVRAAELPPDEGHAYGHGKIENLSGAATAMLILIGGVTAIWEAAHRLVHPQPLAHQDLAIAVMGVSALINMLVSAFLLRVGKAEDSPALLADGHHLRTDILTSGAVFAGLVLNHVTHALWWDSVTAICVSLVVLRVGFGLARDAVRSLVDESLPVHEEAALVHILRVHPQVLGFHKLRSRRSGSYRHADVHVQIADTTSFVEAHRITEELEDRMRTTLPNLNPIIHIEPYDEEEAHQREAHQQDPSPGGPPVTGA